MSRHVLRPKICLGSYVGGSLVLWSPGCEYATYLVRGQTLSLIRKRNLSAANCLDGVQKRKNYFAGKPILCPNDSRRRYSSLRKSSCAILILYMSHFLSYLGSGYSRSHTYSSWGHYLKRWGAYHMRGPLLSWLLYYFHLFYICCSRFVYNFIGHAVSADAWLDWTHLRGSQCMRGMHAQN